MNSSITVDIKDNSQASSYDTLDKAKQIAEAEIQRRIDEFTSPAN
jgi:hypothetical protein